MSLLHVTAHREPLITDIKLFKRRSYNSTILCLLPPWRFLVINTKLLKTVEGLKHVTNSGYSGLNCIS
jgi:hypothetical protein